MSYKINTPTVVSINSGGSDIDIISSDGTVKIKKDGKTYDLSADYLKNALESFITCVDNWANGDVDGPFVTKSHSVMLDDISKGREEGSVVGDNSICLSVNKDGERSKAEAYGCVVIGAANEVADTANFSFCSGSGNSVESRGFDCIWGNENQVSGVGHNFVSGAYNKVAGYNNNVVLGSRNEVDGAFCFSFGLQNATDFAGLSYQFLLGAGNHVKDTDLGQQGREASNLEATTKTLCQFGAFVLVIATKKTIYIKAHA